MTTQRKRDGSEELARSASLESYDDSNYTSPDDDESAIHLLQKRSTGTTSSPAGYITGLAKLASWRRVGNRAVRRARRIRRGQGYASLWLRRFLRVVYGCCCCLLALTVVVGVFFPSYTRLPPHYAALRDRIRKGQEVGSGNIHKEKIFIAASIFDPGAGLANGDWAKNVLELVHILGPENVYLSIYENDSGEDAVEALAKLQTRVPCNHTLISEAHLRLETLPHVMLQDGSRRVKRIAYLAEVRNRALRPLQEATQRFDKLLYLNDVMFDPIEAAQLLFSTNLGADGRTLYRSACAVDFINPFKFYDTFATRDLDGFSVGVPFFPWFSAGGGDHTLDDVLSEADAVRVRSCWGGMVAFDAKFFQNWSGEAKSLRTAGSESPVNVTAPFKFRAEKDLWWDSSECCLIQADIQSPDPRTPGIFMNPFIRVAYDSRTLSWLWLTKRFEKLYTPIHFMADILVSLPDFNPRRHEVPWQTVDEVVWVADGSDTGQGSWQNVMRTAKHDGFCGRRKLPVLREPRIDGERNWEFIEPPPLID